MGHRHFGLDFIGLFFVYRTVGIYGFYPGIGRIIRPSMPHQIIKSKKALGTAHLAAPDPDLPPRGTQKNLTDLAWGGWLVPRRPKKSTRVGQIFV
jgi:hypothetical protein